jgi:CheY-like chemotaxis protein
MCLTAGAGAEPGIDDLAISDEEKARAAGCDHYVTKPYSPMQILRLVRGFLGDA